MPPEAANGEVPGPAPVTRWLWKAGEQAVPYRLPLRRLIGFDDALSALVELSC
jgi:hypothetical protein